MDGKDGKVSYDSEHLMIRSIAQYYAVPEILALAMADLESTFHTDAVGDDGHSVGLYQLHDEGMGYGLYDFRYMGPVNAAVALRSLRDTSSNGTWGEWAARSQRPFDPVGYAATIDAYVADAANKYPGGNPVDCSGPLQAIAYMADTVGDSIQINIDEIRRVRTQFVGPRP